MTDVKTLAAELAKSGAVTTDLGELVSVLNDNLKTLNEISLEFLRTVAYMTATVGVIYETSGEATFDKLVTDGTVKDPSKLVSELAGDLDEGRLNSALIRVLGDIKSNQSLTNTADFKRSDLSDLLN